MALRESHIVEITVTKDGRVVKQNTWESGHALSYGVNYPLACPKAAGESVTYTVTLTYLGEKQYQKTKEQRQKAYDASQLRRKKYEETAAAAKLARQEKELVQRQKRIANQIELAFVKKLRGAVDFITCDQCDGQAQFLGLTHQNPGSDVIDPEQITGAWCEEHGQRKTTYGLVGALPFKTKASIACERLEFFFDGLRQLCIKAGA